MTNNGLAKVLEQQDAATTAMLNGILAPTSTPGRFLMT